MTSKRDAFTETYAKYYSLIFSTVLTKIDDVDDARDICQDIFTRFFEKFESVENHRKWLYGTMKNVIMEFIRAKQGGSVDIDDVFNDVGLTFVNGFRDARIVISEAIEDMENFSDEEDKIIFDLVAVYNFSYSQAAKKLGFTKRKVEYRYRLIADRIIDYLNKKGIKNIEDLL